MKTEKKLFNKEKYINLDINGYKWFSHSNNIHSFYKKVDNGFYTIECSEEQIENGDLWFMTKHNLTLSKKLKKHLTKVF